MITDKFFGAFTMLVFGALAVAAFIGAFWNPWQLIICAMCVIVFFTGLSEYRKK
ncbi:hypothetical protein [Elizabethkingia phage TCUEAP2]|nr:hypothetical protein [Elizabethkingia phage TCUEAP2]